MPINEKARMWAGFELLIKTLTTEVALAVLNLFSFPEPGRENDEEKTIAKNDSILSLKLYHVPLLKS